MKQAKDVHVAGGQEDATSRIQSAIDQGEDGPVRVVLEPGVFQCGGLRLKSDVELHVSEGAELRFIPDYSAYAHTEVEVVAENSNRGMIVARDCANIAITGNGRIICDSAAFVIGEDPGMDIHTPADLRPRVLVVERCRNVSLRDLFVSDSPMWTLHFVDCDDVTIEGVRVENNLSMPNTDGLVIDGCRKVSVRNCSIRTADDGVVLKTSIGADGQPIGPCSDVIVSDCDVESHSCALKIGTESYADFNNISFVDCRIVNSNRGLGIFSRDGGAVNQVRFSRIEINCHETPTGFWGSGEGICINVLDRRPETRPAGFVSDVVIEDITGTMEGAINLIAEKLDGISNLTLRRISITQKAGPLGTASSYDLRPTPADLEPSEDGVGRQNSWRLGPDGKIIGCVAYPGGMPGIYARNASGIQIENVMITRNEPLPTRFNADVIVRE